MTAIVEQPGQLQRSYLEDESAPESTIDCTGCSAPCCRLRHVDAVPLSQLEAQRLPHHFGRIRLENGKEVENVALLERHPLTGDCIFLHDVEGTDGRREGHCSIWAKRPKTCRAYSCLTDQHPSMKEFVEERFGRASKESAP